jgi:uncharacterized protein (TIGR00645 family)
MPMTTKQTKTERAAEAIVFDSRWILYPLTIGLLIALLVYAVKFVVEAYALVINGLHMEAEQVMVALLGLVDMYMVANLIVMISQGSYQIFVQKFIIIDPMKRPQWLDHVDSSILKVKMATSIAGITLIRVLKDFVNIENVSWDVIVHRMYIHGLCLLSAIALALIWRLLHVPDPPTHHGSEVPEPSVGRPIQLPAASDARP